MLIVLHKVGCHSPMHIKMRSCETILRQHVTDSPSLGPELLRAFHDSDDPAPLTELLRLFSAIALLMPTTTASCAASEAVVATRIDDERPAGGPASATPVRGGTAPQTAVVRGGGLVLGLADNGTLERLAFFLENSLEERLLAWVRGGWRTCALLGFYVRRVMMLGLDEDERWQKPIFCGFFLVGSARRLVLRGNSGIPDESHRFAIPRCLDLLYLVPCRLFLARYWGPNKFLFVRPWRRRAR